MILSFGKYKDKTIEEVVGIDKGYAIWASQNMKSDSMRDAFLAALNDNPAEYTSQSEYTNKSVVFKTQYFKDLTQYWTEDAKQRLLLEINSYDKTAPF